MICRTIVFIAVAALLAAQSGRQDADYENGMRELDARQWDQAIASFDASARHKSGNADAAVYWKAYAEYRAGRLDAALEALSDLHADYPSSRWIKDADELQMEVKGRTGAPVSPAAQNDDELRLLALNSLMQSDPNQALPILQKLLAGNNSDKVKERAMFVLTMT